MSNVNNFKMPSHILKVSELTQQIKYLLEENFPFVWVEGEISNVTLHSTGHFFFTLKDKKAQIRAIMFRSQAQFLPFKLENGIQVVIRGRINVYEPRGEYQIVADVMEPLGKGSLQLALEQIKKKLATEGLFDPSRKKPLPVLPQRIGIITSPTGAAVQDILRIISQRFVNLEILIIPVRVQGPEAPGEIIQALERVNTLDPRLDVVILARGGGSLEDLWAFNDEGVARAICKCQTPVMSAVGHEIDFTISDFVADVRAPTPSAAAEMVVEKKEHLLNVLDVLQSRMEKGVYYSLNACKSALKLSLQGLADPRKKVVDLTLKNDDITQRLINVSFQAHQRKQEHWKHLSGMFLLFSPVGKIKVWREELSRKNETLKTLLQWKLERYSGALAKSVAQLDAASPLNILKRGYSITRTWPDKEIVRDANTLTLQQTLNVKLSQGEVFCKVEEIKKG
jgi:exodeoxyribonuclease VII large subunit